MSPDDPPDDDRGTPPRASWEPAEPDEAAPVTAPPASKSKPTPAWTPPPLDDLPPRKKAQRAQPKPPRASWEAPDPDDEPSSGIVAPAAGEVTPSERYAADVQAGAKAGSYTQSGSYTQPAGASGPADAAGGSYEQLADAQGAYASGAYATPEGGYAPASEAYTSGTQPTASEAYAPPSMPAATASSSGVPSPSTGSPTGAVRGSDSDDPMAPLPTIAADNTLRSAVGAKPVKEPRKKAPRFDDDGGDGGGGDDDEDDDDDRPKRGRGMWIAVFAAVVGVIGLGIGALVVFGNLNKERFLIACEPQEVHAKQGRGFPPWGFRSIEDEGMWKPIKIPPEAECRERETEDETELSRWYLEILTERASSLLTAREVTKIDDAAAMLDQALLHARSPDRREQRREIERLLGDVGYWRASAKLKDASTALTDAAKQFDAAAAQRPRHVSDASAWATYVRKLVEELRAGPNGALTAFPPTPIPTPGGEPAPPGVALPVEPSGSGSAEPPPAPPDAGLPTGGVLL